MNLYTLLEELNIKYDECSHMAVYTMDEASNISDIIDGTESKTLFLKHKKRYYLILIAGNKRADLKKIADISGESKLSFANEEALLEILGLTPGSVTPLGLINDLESKVKVVIDKTLRNQKILVHPCINTKTISIKYDDLIKFIEATEHEYIETEL